MLTNMVIQTNIENTNKYVSKNGGTLFVQTFQGEVGGFFKVAEGLAFNQSQNSWKRIAAG